MIFVVLTLIHFKSCNLTVFQIFVAFKSEARTTVSCSNREVVNLRESSSVLPVAIIEY